MKKIKKHPNLRRTVFLAIALLVVMVVAAILYLRAYVSLEGRIEEYSKCKWSIKEAQISYAQDPSTATLSRVLSSNKSLFIMVTRDGKMQFWHKGFDGDNDGGRPVSQEAYNAWVKRGEIPNGDITIPGFDFSIPKR